MCESNSESVEQLSAESLTDFPTDKNSSVYDPISAEAQPNNIKSIHVSVNGQGNSDNLGTAGTNFAAQSPNPVFGTRVDNQTFNINTLKYVVSFE